MKKQLVAILIFVVFIGCSKNDESLINHLELDSYLEPSQFSFLERFENMDLKIDENEKISGTAYRRGKPYLIETSTDFSAVSTLTFPSVFQYAQILYENKDTIVLVKNTGYELNLYRSVNQNDFVIFYTQSLRDVNNREIGVSDIAMKNATVGYFYTSKEFGSVNYEVSLLKIDGNQVRTLTTEKPGVGGKLLIFPNGKLLSTQMRPNREDIVVSSESYDEGLTWDRDTSDWNTFKVISEIVDNDFVLNFVLGRLYTSADGKSWNQIVSPQFNSVQDYQFFNKRIAYLITKVDNGLYDEICDLYKTTDGGVTWEKVNSKKFYAKKFHFYNKNLGIAYNNKAIQITRDGGVTWELIAIKEFRF